MWNGRFSFNTGSATNLPDICRAIRAMRLQGEALKDYYRTKPTQWAIYCWEPRGCGQVLERGAVCQERRVSEGRAHHPVGVRGLTLVADPRWRR